MTRPTRARGPARLGVLGGTFNPIHLAHLRCAEEIAEAFAFERVLFLPSASPPHKQAQGLAPAAHRLAMVKRAITGNPRFRASAIELQRSGRSYTVDTLGALRQRQPNAELYFILGRDAFADIETWKDYQSLFELAHLVVISRPPNSERPRRTLLPVAVRSQFCYRPRLRGFVHRSGHCVYFHTVTALDISASDIRARLAHGRSIRYLVPPPVAAYIERHRLYAPGIGRT